MKQFSLSIFLLLCSSAFAQTPNHFLLQITDMRTNRYVCTALTEDGLLRREVTEIEIGRINSPQIYEAPASDEDKKKVHDLVTNPSFQAAAQQNVVIRSEVTLDGKIITVWANVDGELKIASYSDHVGQASAPDYLKPFEAFEDEVKHRKMPKLKGKAEPICSPQVRG